MHAALTVRKLRAGAFDEWRQAWEPDTWPEGSKKAYILRNVNDPDEVIAFGFFEGDFAAMAADESFREQTKKRFERMEPHVESTGTDGLYEVVEVVTPAAPAPLAELQAGPGHRASARSPRQASSSRSRRAYAGAVGSFSWRK